MPTANSRAAVRELAQRLSGTDEIRLVWNPATDRIELSVRDVETGVGFRIAVSPCRAVDAFNHPYAYAPTHAEVDCGDHTGTPAPDC